LVGLLPTNLII